MRVGVISTVFPTKRNPAAGIYVKEELDSLTGHCEVRLIAPIANHHWFGESRSNAAHQNYPVVRPLTLGFPRWFMQRLYPSSMAVTLRLVGKSLFEGCDIVHAHNAFPEGGAAVKAFGGRFPVIITAHGSDLHLFAMKPNLRPGIVKALNSAKRIICVSSFLTKTLRMLGVTTKTVVIPNGIDVSFLTPGDKEQSSEFLGLEPDRARIIFAGNFFEVKGIEYLIQAMPAVLEKKPDCELILLGARPDSSDRHRYKKNIDSAGVSHAIRIVDRMPHEEIPTWISASDLLVLPSIREGFGLVAAEALACGRPVVATKSGGPEDIVQECMGILVPTRDPESMAHAILKVFDGEGIMSPESLAESARSRFSYEIVAGKILDVYNTVLREFA
ncbi:glycosyltransferase [Candidatus Latescibacterota bacterium]